MARRLQPFGGRLRAAGKAGGEITGTLRVSMPETILTYKSQPFIRAFREAAPRVKLLVQTQNCYAARCRLLNGEIDVAVHYNVGGASGSVVTHELADFRQALVASPSLAAEEGDFVSCGQHKSVTLISNDKHCISQEIFDGYLRERDIFIENVIELWSVEAIKRSVMSDLGVAFLPYFAVSGELESGQLVELETELKENRITAFCSYHKNKWKSPAIELFINLAKEYFSGGSV
ncbi:substrate-binding domain-containing protein [Cloacibacillus sp. An23]|uniref:substrate-binding domain-containing protein n=1 Tax=Cloacibacillus sp. An23 TaxID=1965591 RepID=UPI0021007AA8|nr:substrate-binding domain-containing protein [Cloacibacillus sp. An23]